MRIKHHTSGFSLVETAIVLLIAGLLVAGAYQLMTSMQQQRADQAAANEMRTIATALERFLTEQQGVLAINNALNVQGENVRLTDNLFIRIGNADQRALTYFQQNYLPTTTTAGGFDLTAAGYVIGIRRMNDVAGTGGNRPVFRGLVLRNLAGGGNNEGRTSRIATLVGSQGGVVRDNGSGSPEISGVQGLWAVNAAQYGLPGLAQIGQIAAYTTSTDGQINTSTVSRVTTANSFESNTMRTDLIMGDTVGRSQTYAIRNAAGYGQTRTDAREDEECENETVELLDPVGGTFTPAKELEVDKFMVLTGLDLSSAPALLQCLDESGTWRWKQVGDAAFGTNLGHRAFFENQDYNDFLFSGMDDRFGVTGDQAVHPAWLGFITDINDTNFPASRVTAPFGASRATNRWYYNDTGRPLVVSILCGDGVDWAYIYVRDNYDFSTGSSTSRARIVAAIKSRDNDGAYSMTAIIPVNAAFAMGMPRNFNKSRVEYWSEYNAY